MSAEKIAEVLAPVMRAWGIRSQHGDWTDAEAVAQAAKEGARALAPLLAAEREAGRAEVRNVVEASVRLISPDHITPTGARLIRAALRGDA